MGGGVYLRFLRNEAYLFWPGVKSFYLVGWAIIRKKKVCIWKSEQLRAWKKNVNSSFHVENKNNEDGMEKKSSI